jgi:hypothetical protein
MTLSVLFRPICAGVARALGRRKREPYTFDLGTNRALSECSQAPPRSIEWPVPEAPNGSRTGTRKRKRKTANP